MAKLSGLTVIPGDRSHALGLVILGKDRRGSSRNWWSMSTSIDWRRVVRIISAVAGDANVHETVNVITVKNNGTDPHNSIKEHVQITAAQYNALGPYKEQIDTFRDSGGTVKGLRTIYVSGYTAPS